MVSRARVPAQRRSHAARLQIKRLGMMALASLCYGILTQPGHQIAAWLSLGIPTAEESQRAVARRRVLSGVSAGLLAGPALEREALAVGRVEMPFEDVTYEEVPCNPNKGEMLRGTMVTRGLEARCIKATGTLVNPETKALKNSAVYGRIDDVEAQTSVLANALDGSSDVGQFTMIESIPPGESQTSFRFVAALPQGQPGLPKLSFRSLKAVWLPGGDRFKLVEVSEACQDDPTLDECL
mmetsp:Transcript_31244/g.71337  ORF Transcript_31244/g.71337 Transcript_31244/m.71337 type:complete len:239 (-) Transcript_31244:86-802(-)